MAGQNQIRSGAEVGEIRARVAALGPWFQNLDLGGVQTAPDHPAGNQASGTWRHVVEALPADLHGMTVLDIGCNAGFHAIEMKRRGAERVIGIDSDPACLAQAQFAAEVCGVELDLRQLSVYEVARLGERFDLVLFMGLLHHLRYPLLALDLIHQHVARNLLLLQSMLRGSQAILPLGQDYDVWDRQMFEEPSYPRLHFVENRYAGDETSWWIPNRACAEAMLRSAGFDVVAQPEREIFLCRWQPALGPARRAYLPPEMP